MMSFWKINMLITAELVQYPVIWPYKYVFTRGIPTISSCLLIIPEMYSVYNILYAFLVAQIFWHTYFIMCKVIAMVTVSSMLGIIWAHEAECCKRHMVIFSSCNLWQLDKGHISETAVQATYTRVILCTVGALHLLRFMLLRGCSEHIL